MWSLRRYSRGKTSSNCIILQAKKITVQSDRQMWIQLDSEYIRDTGVSVKVVPHAVRMVAMDNLSYQKL
jgi:diacylglycerol kinase family enzyme